MEGERCPSCHRFSHEQCTREKGHDGVCSGRAQRGATTITRAEWWSENNPSTLQRADLEQGTLKAPFPAFGGKSRIARVVWDRLGADVRNYVENFAFSSAVLLRRPGGAGAVETINDRNAFVSNFWRAVQRDPAAVAAHADWPVNEVDLHARHRWLVTSDEAAAILERVREDPDAYDARIAGWWCWGACCWIGSGWCDETHRNSRANQRPDIKGQMVTAAVMEKRCKLTGNGVGAGVHANPDEAILSEKMPHMTSSLGVNQGPSVKMPHMDPAGRLVLSPPEGERADMHEKRPRAHTNGRGWMPGVLGPGERQPALAQDGWGITVGIDPGDGAGVCEARRRWVTAWMLRLADRLRTVRVCCGHWSRICDSPSTMSLLGLTGVFLDPPYRTHLGDGSVNRTRHIYANDRHQDVNALCDEVQAWALKWAPDPLVRIALCGLEGEYPEIDRTVGQPGGWTVHAWKSKGGYGNRKGGDSNENRHRERVWFSPHCLPEKSEGGLWG